MNWQTIRTITVVIPAVAVFSLMSISAATAIPNNNDNDTSAATVSDFLTYENNQYGYTIRYPSGWTIHENMISPEIEKAASAYIPSVNIWSSSDGATASSLSITVKDVSQYLDTNDMQLKNKTPHDYVLDKINGFATSTIGEKYVKDKAVTFTNNTIQAWELDYTYPFFGQKTVYNIEYFMTKDNRLYVFGFTSDALKVPTFLPIVQKMIDSFQVIK
jgi:PsbP-like protein